MPDNVTPSNCTQRQAPTGTRHPSFNTKKPRRSYPEFSLISQGNSDYSQKSAIELTFSFSITVVLRSAMKVLETPISQDDSSAAKLQYHWSSKQC